MFLFFYLSTFFLPAVALAQDLAFPEYTIKAAFLFNFGKYVDWPTVSNSGASPDILNICVQGKNPFGEELKALEGKSVRSSKIKVSYVDILKNERDIQNCNILFISDSEKNTLPEILKKLDGYPVLTVTDLDNSPDPGSMINLIVIDDKIRFKINLDSARRAGIGISSQLLKLAVEVTE